jgi:2-iminobutanoate/2-iminopropanoate deaminase
MKVKTMKRHLGEGMFPLFAKGTAVELGEENTHYPGWFGCKIDGYSTYVPEVFACDGKLTRDYNPTELAVIAGDVLELNQIVCGWLNVTRSDGVTGWIPAEIVEGENDTMIQRMPTHCGDETCPSCVVAGDFVFLAHHAGGFDRQDIAHQTRKALDGIKKTLATAGATLDDMVQLNLYIKNIGDFNEGRNVFPEYFQNGAPARMTVVTAFVDERCLCQIDGVAYKPSHNKKEE